MFLKKLDRDFTEEEINNYLMPHYNLITNYMENCVIPQVIAYYLATGYYHSLMFEDTFNIHIKSIQDELFNYQAKDLKETKEKVKYILENKYSLKVRCERPLKFEELVKKYDILN